MAEANKAAPKAAVEKTAVKRHHQGQKGTGKEEVGIENQGQSHH